MMLSREQKKDVSSSSATDRNQVTESTAQISDSDWMRKLRRFVVEQDHSGAIKMLRATGDGPDARNAVGVCLMRAGKAQEAIEVLRSLVLEPGTLVERAEVPPHFRRNFATALLMSQNITGCLQLIRRGKVDQHYVSIQLVQSIKNWEKTLSFWQKFNWKMYAMMPANRPIQLTFVPGEFSPDPPVQSAE